MAICSISEKAIRAAEKLNIGALFRSSDMYRYIQKKDHQYPSTPSIPHMYARLSIRKILEEGLTIDLKDI